ncbi:putative superoxide reductase [Peptoanaerobacter stomatis]|uniref:Putative superoxide reductase n=1 Tax=Peptoanaerobacter stomatis TaxID=796937 RepID=J5WSX2_9FIRM|nr:class II SORL domain-containing protein [Peptoanaerobacter stomatis]EJU24132.1 putative superoxide reductase [Peptoanaerobacter stomatis]NWO25701.1 superoxide reductase [Peptostreptococcaceae bacterium oral taxon 081]
MSVLGQLIQTGDWKGEKHVPAITAPQTVKVGEVAEVKVCIGQEIAHPNTLEHHISWIKLLFVPSGGKLPVELAHSEFSANGELEIFTSPSLVANVKLPKSGTLVAVSYCNIHGLWESSVEITVE